MGVADLFCGCWLQHRYSDRHDDVSRDDKRKIAGHDDDDDNDDDDVAHGDDVAHDDDARDDDDDAADDDGLLMMMTHPAANPSLHAPPVQDGHTQHACMYCLVSQVSLQAPPRNMDAADLDLDELKGARMFRSMTLSSWRPAEFAYLLGGQVWYIFL